MNLNDRVWVQMTELGWKIYDDFHSQLGLDPVRYRAHIMGPPGWQHFQLWEIMEMFGPHTHMGLDCCFFEKNEMRLEKPD